METWKGFAKANARVKRTMVICTAAKEALKPERKQQQGLQKERLANEQ